jgi:hypothetical protein
MRVLRELKDGLCDVVHESGANSREGEYRCVKCEGVRLARESRG